MSESKSDWYEVCGCHHCGYLSTYSHKLHPCAGCGANGSSSSWDRFVIRDISYGLLHRLGCLLSFSRQPRNHIQWKDDKKPRFFRTEPTKPGFELKPPKDAE